MIRGRVITGDQIGRTLGWPTANLDILPEKTHLSDGVYAAFAVFHGVVYDAGLVVNRGTGKVEVHLLGYVGPEFYGEDLEVEALELVSRLERFDSDDELQEKIQQDIVKIKSVLPLYGKDKKRDDNQTI